MVDCPSPRLFRQPRLFGQALVSDLPNLHLSPSILQYVNYLHLCSSYYLPPTYYYSPQLLSRERIPSLKKDSTVRLPGHLHGSHHNSSTPCHHPTWKGTYCLPFSLKTRPLLGTCRVRPHLDPQFQCPCSCLTSDTRGPLTEPLNPTTNNPYFKRLQQALILASLRPLQTFQLMKTKCQTQPCHSYPFLTKISHSCREILDFKTPHFSNIDQPLSNPNYTWFIDGSSCSQPCSITRWTC